MFSQDARNCWYLTIGWSFPDEWCHIQVLELVGEDLAVGNGVFCSSAWEMKSHHTVGDKWKRPECRKNYFEGYLHCQKYGPLSCHWETMLDSYNLK